MQTEVSSPIPERRGMSPTFTAIRRSVRSDGFERLEAQRVLPPILVGHMPRFLHTDPIGTPRLVIRNGDGWVVMGHHTDVLHQIPAPDSEVPAGTVFYQPYHQIAYRLGVIDDPIQLPEGQLLYSNDSEWMVLVGYRTGQSVPVISMTVSMDAAGGTNGDDINRAQRHVSFAVFPMPERPTVADVLGALSSFRELVPLVRGASLYRYGNGFIVRAPLATSYVEYPVDTLQPDFVANATDKAGSIPGVVEIPVNADLDIGSLAGGDWILHPSGEQEHDLYVSDIAMCLSPAGYGYPQQPKTNTYVYRPDMYTLGHVCINVQKLLHLLWRYVGTGAGALVALIDPRRSGYHRTLSPYWTICLVYAAAVTRSEHGTRLIAPIPSPSTHLVHLWLGHHHHR